MMRQHRPWFLLLLSFSPLLFAVQTGHFFWTDTIEIADGAQVFRSLTDLLGAVRRGVHGQYYRPTVFVLNSANAFLTGGSPLGYRAGNLLLHVGNALCVYALLRRDSRVRNLAWLVSASFAVHPLAATSINWVADRTDLAAFFFCLAFVHSALSYLGNGSKGALGSACACFVLALGAKENCIAVLFLAVGVVIATQGLVRHRAIVVLFAHLALTGAYLVWRARLPGAELVRGDNLDVLARLGLAVSIHLEYARDLLIPHLLTVCDGRRVPVDCWPLAVAAVLGVLLGVLGLLRWGKRLDRAVFWGLFWIVAFTLPTCGIVRLAHVRADRYLYFALPAVMLVFVRSAQCALQRARVPGGRFVSLAAAACLYLYLTSGLVVRAQRFVDDRSLWTAEVADDEACLEGHSYLARDAYLRGDLDRATAEIEKALESPRGLVAFVDRWTLRYYWGRILLDTGRIGKGTAIMNGVLQGAADESLRGEAAYALAVSALERNNMQLAEGYLSMAARGRVAPSSRADVFLLRSYANLRLGRREQCAADYDRYLASPRVAESPLRDRIAGEVSRAIGRG